MFGLDLDEQCLDDIVIVILVLYIAFLIFKPKLDTFLAVAPSGVLKDKSEGPVYGANGTLIMDGASLKAGGFEDGTAGFVNGEVADTYYFLDDGNGGKTTLLNNITSPACCSPQYPTPFKTNDPYVCSADTEFVPTNYFGNTAFSGAGCICATQSQVTSMARRYGNSTPHF